MQFISTHHSKTGAGKGNRLDLTCCCQKCCNCLPHLYPSSFFGRLLQSTIFHLDGVCSVEENSSLNSLLTHSVAAQCDLYFLHLQTETNPLNLLQNVKQNKEPSMSLKSTADSEHFLHSFKVFS